MITINNPQQVVNRNYLKNPNFQVIQGTASGTLANSTALPTASLGYLGETEWCIAASGGTPAYAFSSANESITFTGAASTTAIYLLQRLESKDITTLANKLAIVTFSFEASNSLLTSLNWSILRPTTTADTHGTIASPTQTSIASGTITINSTLTRYSVTAILPLAAALGAEFRLQVGAQTSGTWVVARLQLEEWNTSTTFTCGDYAAELQRCQRHFCKSFEIGTPPAQNAGRASAIEFLAGVGAGVVGSYDIRFPMPMGFQPVITLYNPSAANAQVRNQTISADCTSTTASATVGSGSSGFNLRATGAASQVSTEFLSIHYAAAAHIA